MALCKHERVCTEYMRRYGKILSKHCPNPNRCPFFEKSDAVTIKEFTEAFADTMAEIMEVDGGHVKHVKSKAVPREDVDDCFGV